jgi:hypothetical protein
VTLVDKQSVNHKKSKDTSRFIPAKSVKCQHNEVNTDTVETQKAKKIKPIIHHASKYQAPVGLI